MAYGNSFQRTSPIVLNLIIINVLVYFAQSVFGGPDENNNNVIRMFGLHHFRSEFFEPYQLVTHMFLHGGLFHLLFNMLGLWMFGSTLEKVWGPKRFLIFYMICGLTAGFTQLASYAYDFAGATPYGTDVTKYIKSQFAVTIGASGATMGIFAAFGYLFPNTTLIVFPIPVPVKAKWVVIGLIVLDVFGGVNRVPGDNIAHFAHVGGALAGLIIVLIWNKTNKRTFY